MYCRGAYRVSPFADFPDTDRPVYARAARGNLKNRHGVSGRRGIAFHNNFIISTRREMEAVDFATNYNRDSHRHDTRKQMPLDLIRSAAIGMDLLDSTDDSTERYIVETNIRVIAIT